MKRFKKNIILTTTPIVLFLGYRFNKRLKAKSEEDRKELEKLRSQNIWIEKVRFDQQLNYDKHWITENIARGATPPLKTRKENIKELKDQQYDILINGSSPLAALTLLQATNRGLKVALITDSDFSSSNQEKNLTNVQMLDSGIDIFKNAITFKYGALSSRMIGHALQISKARLKLKDMAPRSVKEEYYSHYYSKEMSRLQKIKAFAADTVWKSFNILRTAFGDTDSGFSLPYFINQESKFRRSKRGELLLELQGGQKFSKSNLMTREFEINWDSFVRDAVVTASVENYILQGKTGASVLSRAKIVKKHFHQTNQRVERVSLRDLQSGKIFDVKVSCILDFTEPTTQNTKYMSNGLFMTPFTFSDFSLQNHKKYCIQTPTGKTFYQGLESSLYRNETNSLRILQKQANFQDIETTPAHFQKLEYQIQTLPISDTQSELLKKFNSVDYHISLFKGKKSESGEASLNLELLKREGFQINSFLDRFRALRSDTSLYLSYYIHRLINYCHLKMWKSPYQLKPALLHSYDWKSERDGSFVKVIGGHPSLAATYASRIIDDLMKEKIFIFQNPKVNPEYQTLGYYPFVGNLSAPALSSKDWSAATSISYSALFKEELQADYIINDTLFGRLFRNYGFSGTLKIVEIGIHLNKINSSLLNRNFERTEEVLKKIEKNTDGQQVVQKQTKEPVQQHQGLKWENIYTAAQVIYLSRYLGLTRVEDLIKRRWNLMAEKPQLIESVSKMAVKAMKQEYNWKWEREQQELTFLKQLKQKQQPEKKK